MKPIYKRGSILVFIILFLLCCLYLYLIGEGYLLNTVHSMMNESSVGGFHVKQAGSTPIDCAEFHKKFPQFINVKNVVTDPTPLNDGSGLYERFVKADKSIIDTSKLSWKDQMALSLTSNESKCARSLGSFLNAVQGASK